MLLLTMNNCVDYQGQRVVRHVVSVSLYDTEKESVTGFIQIIILIIIIIIIMIQIFYFYGIYFHSYFIFMNIN